jgi:TRAP-type uncharacterized transport system substrate-binding protein
MTSQTPPTDLLRRLLSRPIFSVGLALVVLFLVSLALFHFSDFRASKPDVVRIAYAAGAPLRRHFLEEMVAAGKAQNLDIRLIPTQGTGATLERINQHVADMGLVPGGIVGQADRKLVEITPLYMEPLQLVVKAELYEPVVKDFGELRGRSIGMDGANSATSVLATELLRFIGLSDAAGNPLYRPVYMPQGQIAAAKAGADLPDAIFQIGGVPSATIARLVRDHGYRLVALPFGGSFSLSEFRDSAPAGPVAGARLTIDKSFVEEAVIPAYVYGVLPAAPATDTRTVATRLLLVGGEDLPVGVVKRIVALVMGPQVSQIVQPQLTKALLESEFQFKRHPGTDAYLASLEPFNVDGAFSGYQRIVEIWGILVAAYLAVANGAKWLGERRERKPRGSVGHFMGRILEVEAQVHGAASDAERRALDEQLSDIKKQSIELHLEDRLDDADNLQALLVALADTRAQLQGAAA